MEDGPPQSLSPAARATPAELARLSALLDEALDLPEVGRAEWLEKLRAESAPLATTLAGLLARAASSETADLLDRGPSLASPGEPPDFAAGDTVGPYRLLRPIGQGGMGEVWLAERADGQLKRQVALKLPMLGLRRSVLVQRFERERDILASLAHPHIARLYDAGLAADGQPYLALEHVEGIPIGQYCDAKRLDARARVELLRQVMQAVQYAHANLVIHRDLKPSNVLVTAQGQARLLDFGIAKLLQDDQAQADETELTRVGGRALTLQYAAPEQVSGASISIATDVWALGVLLHELLTGRLPFTGGDRNALERAVLEHDPARPSSLRTGAIKDLPRSLAADLDTIVLKALKKLPADRYTTVNALVVDLGRWLTGEAVLARPDSYRYRAGKFVARHRLPVATGAAFVAVIIVGAGVAMRQAFVAEANAALARSESARALQERNAALAVRDFLIEVFRTADPDTIGYAAQSSGSVRDVLGAGVTRLRRTMDDYPEVKSALFEAMVEILDNLSELSLALDLAREHVEFVQARLDPHHERLVAALIQEAELQTMADRDEEARRSLARAEVALEAASDHASIARARWLVARGALVDSSEADLVGAQRGVELLKARGAPWQQRARALLWVGSRQFELGRFEQAIAAYADAAAQAEGANGAGILRMRALSAQASVLVEAGRQAEAIQVQRRVLAEAQALPEGHPERAKQMLWTGSLLHGHGERAEGRGLLAEGVRRAEHDLPAGSLDRTNAQMNLLQAVVRDGETSAPPATMAALEHALGDTRIPATIRAQITLLMLRHAILRADTHREDRLLTTMSDLGGPVSNEVAAAVMLARADVWILRGNLTRARVELANFDRSATRGDGTPSHFHAGSLAQLQFERRLLDARLALADGRSDDAVAAASAALESAQQRTTAYADDDIARAQLRLAAAWLARGHVDRARPLLADAIRFFEQAHVPSSPWLRQSRRLLARSGQIRS